MQTEPSHSEKSGVRWSRRILRAWPWIRGRGLLLRLLHPFLPEGGFVYELVPGVLLGSGTADYLGQYFFLNGLAKDPLFRLSWDLAPVGGTAVDVGANAGYWSLGAARKLGATGRLEAFEASAEVAMALEDNIRVNQLANIRCHRLAVADVVGESAFLPDPLNTAHGSLAWHADPVTAAVRVPTTTLDQFARENSLAALDLLKIDVEGAEMLVLKGARDILSSESAPVVLLETGDRLAARFGSSSVDVKTLLSGAGYETYRLIRGRLHTVEPAETHPDVEDLLALREHHYQKYPLLRRLSAGWRRAAS